jgi:hypothetical protein
MKKVVILMFLVFSFSLISFANEPKAILITPPAPKFTDSERQAELTKRRNAVAEKMSPNSLLILWSATPRNYAGDVDFMYRQENNHYYLTSLKQNGSTLVLVKNGTTTKEFLFLPKRNPQFETGTAGCIPTKKPRDFQVSKQSLIQPNCKLFCKP